MGKNAVGCFPTSKKKGILPSKVKSNEHSTNWGDESWKKVSHIDYYIYTDTSYGRYTL